MKHLNSLLPAEALLLAEGGACSVKRFLKSTFMDLLLKQVLKAANYKAGYSTEKIIGPGKNYYTYSPRPYEAVLLSLYDGADGRHNQEFFYFAQLVKVAYQKAGTAYRYRRMIFKSSTETGWYTQNLLQQLFGGFSLSDEGLQVRSELLTEIAATEAVLQDCIVNDPGKAQQLLHMIKGNVFLLKNIDMAALTAIDKNLLAELNAKEQQSENGAVYSSGCSGGGCGGGCSAWDSYDHYSGSWDSSCSGDSGSSDGGGSDGGGGDSGCGSSCGGGCGGGD
jgi:hypothetical protein